MKIKKRDLVEPLDVFVSYLVFFSSMAIVLIFYDDIEVKIFEEFFKITAVLFVLFAILYDRLDLYIFRIVTLVLFGIFQTSIIFIIFMVLSDKG